MGEAGAIGSPIIQDLKLREEEEKDSGLRTGLYSPLQVTCRLRAVRYLTASCPYLTAYKPCP